MLIRVVVRRSRSKIMILDSLVWVNLSLPGDKGLCGGVCVWDTHRDRETKETEREDVKLGKGERRCKQRLLWKRSSPGVKSLLGYLGNSCNIQIYLYSLCRDCLLPEVANGSFLFAAPDRLSIWKMIFSILMPFSLLNPPWLPLPHPLPYHSPCDCLSLLGTLRYNSLADCCFSVEGKQKMKRTTHPLGENF